MDEINKKGGKMQWLYSAGFSIILALPILTIPPWFYPPDWGKSIVFRSILAILLFLFIYQFLFKKNELALPNIRKNHTIWALGALFIIFLVASIFSVDPYFSFWGSPYRGGGFITFAFYFIFSILTFIVLKKNDWEKAWIFSVFIGVLASLIALIQFYGIFNSIFVSVSGRPASTLGNPILLAIYLLLLFFPTLSFAIREKNKKIKIFYIFSLVFFLLTILITGSRAAYFGIIAGILYFLFFYPKKLKLLKICIGLFLFFIFIIVLYANIHPQLPKILQNRVIEGTISRLSIKKVFDDERFLAWQIALREVKERPILGWGPENFSVGFDKNYDPKVILTPWWDRAHNMFLDIGAQAGVLGIAAYLALFVVLFWQLYKVKSNYKDTEKYAEPLIPHAIQAALIGYLITNFFSFDSFGTYLVLFFIIGYSLHLAYFETRKNAQNSIQKEEAQKKYLWKYVLAFVMFCVVIAFLWQYNFLPLKINADINNANNLVIGKDCRQAFNLLEKILPEHSFLDSYVRMEYGEFVKSCSDYYPEYRLTYMARGAVLINEATNIQPLYTRYWIFLGNIMNIFAAQEKDTDAKNNLLKQAEYYFDKALQLAPKHQEILIGQAKMEIVAGNYKNAQDYTEKCIALNPNLGDCYWRKAITEIYLKDVTSAKKDIQTADEKKYDIHSKASLGELSDAYGSIQNYKELALIYEKLISIDNTVAQYHSSLAFFYKELGEYKKAREEALRVLDLSPESKPNVDAFLKTLPY